MIAGSVNEATVVGISEKNAPVFQPHPSTDLDLPAAIPETMTKMINGASDMLTGHKTSKASPLLIMAMMRAFTGPI
jgi:hypothetical protein